jgi:hypothetical protein
MTDQQQPDKNVFLFGKDVTPEKIAKTLNDEADRQANALESEAKLKERMRRTWFSPDTSSDEIARRTLEAAGIEDVTPDRENSAGHS